MKYEILYKANGGIHKAAKIYNREHEHLAKRHAKDLKGKAIDRETGEIIADYCPMSKNKNKK